MYFKKTPHRVRFSTGGMCVTHDIPVPNENAEVAGYSSQLVPVREAFPDENDMPVANFSLEKQLQSGIPLQEVNSVILGDRNKAASYLEKQLDKMSESEQQQQQEENE